MKLSPIIIPGLVFATMASAKFITPELVPVERLLKNATRHLAQHPDDAFAHYTLGRIHYLAFVLKIEMLPANPGPENGLPRPAPDELLGQPLAAMRRQRAEELAQEDLGKSVPPPAAAVRLQTVSRFYEQLEKEGWKPPEPSRESLVKHAVEAARAFVKAIELDGRNGLYSLSLGSILEQFADWNDDVRIGAVPAEFDGDLRARARAHYFQAWSKAAEEDTKAVTLPLLGLSSLVSFEAGRGFLRLAGESKGGLPAIEKAAVPRVKATLAKLEKLPPGPVTPLVLALRPVAHLQALLAEHGAVAFDLRGLGERESWTWVQPDAGLLVWDPDDERTITSGRQLFGGYTFRIPWRTGYDALRSLDDDADGELRGSELAGIGVWFDRNSDGRSERSEVAPAESLGIRALSVTATASDGKHPSNPRGVKFQDGRQLPTWDWMAELFSP